MSDRTRVSRPPPSADGYAATQDSLPALAPPVPSEDAAPEALATVGEDRLVGSVIGDRYRVDRVLSRGGQGRVYQGRHILLDKPVAIKVLLRPEDDQAQARFLREARLVTRVRHMHVIDVEDYGRLPDGNSYLVMELLEGRTLDQEIAAGPLPPARAVSIATQILQGLEALHAQGIVHRDLKPANIFLLERNRSRDFVKIVDFGLAKLEAALRNEDIDGRESRELRTRTGTLMGTPWYMAPEQIEGGAVDWRTDQYALGCIFYEMLTRQPPFDARNATAVLLKHLNVSAPPPSQLVPDLARPIEHATLRMLAKAPKERFASWTELEAALTSVAGAPEPPIAPTRRRRRFVLAAAAGAALGLVALLSALLLRAPSDKAGAAAQRPPQSGGAAAPKESAAARPTPPPATAPPPPPAAAPEPSAKARPEAGAAPPPDKGSAGSGASRSRSRPGAKRTAVPRYQVAE